MKYKILTLAALIFLLGLTANAYVASASGPLTLQVLSSKTLSGTAGDFVTVQGSITNTGPQAIQGVTTYLSLSDKQTHKPVDLEDWSAEKGLYVGTIDSGTTLPLDWKIHFVTAGDYSLIIVAETIGDPIPQVSEITEFHVSPKQNLNPAEVLPVALGTPIILIFILFLIAYRRRVEE
ncbi:MAG: hypothetical protein KGH79_01885 [Patescibacteria group bacterium]|nr:hypothetical protein [Patescibacteria group bacterium]